MTKTMQPPSPSRPATASSRARGAELEQLARRFLERRGLQFIAANYRYRRGEIDLIMREGELLIFVEVRGRRRSSYASAAESVTRSKQKALLHAAQHYLCRHRLNPCCRFDVVAIDWRGQAQHIRWIQDAFQDHG